MVVLFGLILAAKMSEFLLFVIEFEIVKKLRCRSEAVEYGEHALTDFGVDLLTISALASRSVLVQRIFNVDELSVGNVLYLNPVNIDRTRPLSILLPHIMVFEFVVNFAEHFGQTAEMFGFINAKEQINFSLDIWIRFLQFVYFFKSSVQNFVSSIC